MSKLTYLKTAGFIAAAAFAITAAVLIAHRLSAQAMAVLAGAACGVSAAIPTSLFILAATRRNSQHTETTPAPARPQFTQPLVFALPQAPIQRQPPPPTWEQVPAQRHFTIVGQPGEE